MTAANNAPVTTQAKGEVAIIDYGYGNIFSVKKAVEKVGGVARVVSNPDELPDVLLTCDRIILPGQGAFPACRRALQPFLSPLLPAILRDKKPTLGICVGMQLLAEVGFEFEEVKGLGLMKGKVQSFLDIWQQRLGKSSQPDLTLPQMAWNQTHKIREHPLLHNINNGDFFYFVHGFAVSDYDMNDVLATAHYGVDYPMIVARDNIAGIQCHPEKSQQVGLQFLKNFITWNGKAAA